jgi:hypothetical protein
MLTFITPILLGFSGAIFLKERQEIISGYRRRRSNCCGCFSQTASIQLRRRYFDRKATVSLWLSRGRSF